MSERARAPEVDEDLIELLTARFRQLAGPGGRIDAAILRKALGLESPYLARRMLAIFDVNGDGVIDQDEFLAAVRRLVFGTEQEKLAFAFRLHDDDGDGAITGEELERMIALGLAEDHVTVRPADVRALADALLREADTNRDGRVSFDEFAAVLRAHPDVLATLLRNEARWIAPNEDLYARFERAPPHPAAGPTLRQRLARFFQNHVAEVGFLAVWGLANVALFIAAVVRYQHLGAHPFVQLARGCGACLDLNGALILVPMMRRMLTWVRKSPLGRVIPVDDAIAFHRLVGNTMVGFALVHTLAHLCNYALVSPSPFLAQLFGTRAGLTGVLLLSVFAVMAFFAREAIRRTRRFELFYRTHLLYLAWFTLVLVHGPVVWMWTVVPIVGFGVEQIARLSRRAMTTRVVAGRALRSGVTRVDLARPPGFTHRAGDYLFLRVPSVAKHEWHPFTISSAPASDALTVHVRSLGNWTTALRVIVELKHATGRPEPLVAQVDGPYGTASSDIFASRHVVLIGAGIGVTPFASVLESILVALSSPSSPGGARRLGALRKVHFFWLNRDQVSFEWFAALLAKLEAADRDGIVDLHICMTQGRPSLTSAALHVARDVRHAAGDPDVVTGLRTQTTMGRPDWDRWLGAIAAEHAGEPVDVYFCGPHGLAAAIRPICKRLGMRFRQEHF